MQIIRITKILIFMLKPFHFALCVWPVSEFNIVRDNLSEKDKLRNLILKVLM